MVGKTRPGYVNHTMEFYDIVEFDESLNLFNQQRKFSYRKFYEMGANPKTMRTDVVFCYRNIPLVGGKSFLSENVLCFQHTMTYFVFIPSSDFKSKLEI